MHDLADSPAVQAIVKALWLLSVALAAVLGARMVNGRAHLAESRRKAETLRQERDEALAALASSHEARQQLEQRLALQSDSVRQTMAAINERLAEARDGRSRSSPAVDPRIIDGRRQAADPMTGEALNEPRSWTEPR